MRKLKATQIVLVVVTLLVIVIPPVVAIGFISAFGVNTIVLDDFCFIQMFENFSNGRLTLYDVTQAHNEHRFFFGRVIRLMLGVLTHWNTVVEMYTSWVFVAMSNVVLLCLFVRLFGFRAYSLVLFVPVSFLVFNLKAYEVFLYGIVLTNSMMVAFLLLSLFLNVCLQSGRKVWIFACASIASAFVSTFAGSGGGLLVWPIGLLQLAAMWRNSTSDVKRPSGQIIGTWVAASALAVFLYFCDLPDLVKPALAGGSAEIAKRVVDYAFILFGFPFVADLESAVMVGGWVISLYLVVLLGSFWRIIFRRDTEMIPAVSIILFGFLAQVMIVVFRAGRFDVSQAASPRYAQLASIGLVGIYLAVLCIRARTKPLLCMKISVLLVVLGLVACSTFIGYRESIRVGCVVRDQNKMYAYWTRNYKLQSHETLWQVYPSDRTGFMAAQLESLRLSIFARTLFDDRNLPIVKGHAVANIDTVNDTNAATSPQPIVIDRKTIKTFSLRGWAFDPITKERARKVTLFVDGKLELPVCYGLSRWDVARGYRSPGLIDCGFLVSCKPDVLPVGRHELSFRLASYDDCVSITPTLLTIDVR